MKNVMKVKFSRSISSSHKQSSHIDAVFLLSVMLIVLYGTAMVFSAGTAYAEVRYNDSFYFIKKQTIWLVIGFAVMYLSSQIKSETLYKYTPHLYVATITLLVLVLVIGFVGNGAQRWISIGPITIQPSQFSALRNCKTVNNSASCKIFYRL